MLLAGRRFGRRRLYAGAKDNLGKPRVSSLKGCVAVLRNEQIWSWSKWATRPRLSANLVLRRRLRVSGFASPELKPKYEVFPTNLAPTSTHGETEAGRGDGLCPS